VEGGDDDDDDNDDGFAGSLWKVMGLKEKRVFAGLMKKVEVFLWKRESGNLEDIIVAGMCIVFAAVGCEKEKSIVLSFFLGLNQWTTKTKS
jgi:hypothetical protein